MLFSVCVNLYISRKILQYLGVEDFGLYTVVGGVVFLLGFINSSMSGSTSRFLSVAIGEENTAKITDTFNAAKHLHFGVAVLILLLGETFGLWIVNNYLNFAAQKMPIVNFVYQISLITVIFSILQVPYSAIVISMERLDIYAKIEIINILLKLCIVLILPFFAFDRLGFYSILLLLVSLCVYIIYKYYCSFNYKSFRYNSKIQLGIIKPMVKFSGWDLLGWGGVSLSTQGRQIFINRFFGVAVNSANGVAASASAIIQAFTNNVIMAFRPRIMKCYAAHDFETMQKLTEIAFTLVILLMGIIIVPIFYYMNYLMELWLVEVPVYTKDFCRLLLIFQFFEAINTVVKLGIHASGKMMKFTIIGSIIQLINVIATYLLYFFDFPVVSTYLVAILLSVFNVLQNMYLLKQIVSSISIIGYLKKIIEGLSICLICFGIGYFCFKFLGADSLGGFFVMLIVNALVISILAFLYNYNKCISFLKSRFNKL